MIHRASNFTRQRFIMFKNKLGEDSTIPKFIHLKIWRRDGVKSSTTVEEGEFKVSIDGCINICIKEAQVTRCHTEAQG